MKNRSNGKLLAAACCLASSLILQPDLLRAGPGDLDTTFGSGGTVAYSIAGSNNNDYGQNLAIQADGKIVSVGYSYLGPHFALARHNADGSIDTTFGNNGTVYSGFGAAQDFGYAVAIQADGKIVAVGSMTNPTFTESYFLVARFNTNGSLDTTFNSTGFATFDFGGYDIAHAVLIQPADQKIVVAGRAANANDDFGIVRYNTNGSLDSTFGSGGSVVTDFGGNSDLIRGLSILPDGRILAVGRTQNSVYHIAVARYNTNGSLDSTFDGDGRVTTLAGVESRGYSVHALEMGKVLVSGPADDGENSVVTLIRYNADGSLDTTFNGSGIILADIYGGSSAIQQSGRIVLAGSYSESSNSDFAAMRFFPNGNLDTNFGMGGRALADFVGTSGTDAGHGVAIQSDGKIVICGEIYNGSHSDFGLARFDSLDHQPDHIISGRGDNIYNLSGAGQAKKLVSKKAKTVRAPLVIQNDGTESDTFDLLGTKGDQYFKVIYTSGANVTGAVFAGTFATEELDPGSSQTCLVTIKPARSRLLKKTRRGKKWLRKSRIFVLTGTSQADPSRKDVAKVKVLHK